MAFSVKSYFDQKVPAALAEHPDKAKEVAAVYLFKVSGADGGTWTVDLVSTPPTCQPGAHGTPQCTIECADTDLRSMVEGGMLAVMSALPSATPVTKPSLSIDAFVSSVESHESIG